MQLYNAHLSSRPDPAIEFPDKEQGLPDDYAKMMFRMSTVLPGKVQAARRYAQTDSLGSWGGAAPRVLLRINADEPK